MTFYQELQLSSVGSKQLIKNTTDSKEKRRHILIYNFKVYLVMAFCVAVVSMYSKLTGSNNSSSWCYRSAGGSGTSPGRFRNPDNTWTALYSRNFRNPHGWAEAGKYGSSVTVCSIFHQCGMHSAADDPGMPQRNYV